MAEAIRSRIRSVVEDILKLEDSELDDRADFITEYQCTSLLFMGLVLGIEREFGVRYAVADTEGVSCVEDFIALTERYLSAKASR
jgi:acyl carrier protein